MAFMRLFYPMAGGGRWDKRDLIAGRSEAGGAASLEKSMFSRSGPRIWIFLFIIH
jgi:hypothetical protein